MRIDAFNKVSQLYQTHSTNKVWKTTAAAKNDKLEISQLGKDYQVAKQAVAQTPDIRQEKVAELKQKIASGNYNVSAEELADKLIDSYFDESI